MIENRNQYGQGMTEYIVIVALVAVAAIAAYQFFGKVVRSQTAGIAAEVSGQSAQAAIDDAKKAGGESGAGAEVKKVKGLNNYQNDH